MTNQIQTVTLEQVLQFINANMDYQMLHEINQAAFHRCKLVKEYRSKQAVRKLNPGDVVSFKGRDGTQHMKIDKVNRTKVEGMPCTVDGVVSTGFRGWIVPAAVCTLVKSA